MMNDYLTKIMTELDFKNEKLSFIHKDQLTEVTLFTKDNRTFLTISIGENNISTLTDFLNTFQAQLFEWGLNEFSDFTNEMTKNAYLILLVEDALADKYEKKIFINIEEDAFFFKKYVLSYSEEELETLLNKTTNKNIVESLGNLAIDQGVFEKFSKKDQERDGYERLLYHLYIKVPVISLPTKAQVIESLEKEIKEELRTKEIHVVNDVLLEKLKEIPDSGIDLKLFKKVIGKL